MQQPLKADIFNIGVCKLQRALTSFKIVVN